MKSGIIVTGLGLLCTLILAPFAVALGVGAGAGVAGILDGSADNASLETVVNEEEVPNEVPEPKGEDTVEAEKEEAPAAPKPVNTASKKEAVTTSDRATRSGASSSSSRSSSSRSSTSSSRRRASSGSSTPSRVAPKPVEPKIDEFLLEEEPPMDEEEEMDIDSVLDDFQIDMLDEEDEPKKKRKKKK